MNCYKNIREELEALNELNNSKTEFGMVKEFDGNGGVTRQQLSKIFKISTVKLSQASVINLE